MKQSLSKLLLLFLFVISSTLVAQTQEAKTKEQRKAEKKLQKEEKAAKEEAQWQAYNLMIASKFFMIRINQVNAAALQNSHARLGVQNTTLSPLLNFIVVFQDSVIIQLSNPAFIGNNGLGGFTLKGRLVDYKYTPPKKKGNPIRVIFQFESNHSVGQLLVDIMVFNEGRAEVSFGASGYKLVGNIKNPKDSKFILGKDTLD